MSRSWGHLSLFLSSFTNNTTKTANETFQPLRGIFSIQRTHELIGCRLQSLWCVQVQLSDWDAGDWRGHISCPLSLLVEVNVEHLSPNIKFRNWIISDGHTCRRCSVTCFQIHSVTQDQTCGNTGTWGSTFTFTFLLHLFLVLYKIWKQTDQEF